MEDATKKLLKHLWTHKYVGARHTSEDKIIKKVTSKLIDKRIFEVEYNTIKMYLIREKKRTKKSSDWHISIDPKHLKEVMHIIGEQDGRF